MTNIIKGEHKTAETKDDTYGKQPMTIQGWRQDLNYNKTHLSKANKVNATETWKRVLELWSTLHAPALSASGNHDRLIPK